MHQYVWFGTMAICKHVAGFLDVDFSVMLRNIFYNIASRGAVENTEPWILGFVGVCLNPVLFKLVHV